MCITMALIIALGIDILPRQTYTITSQSKRDILLIVTGTNLQVSESKIVARFMRVYDTGGDPNKYLISTVYTGDFTSARVKPSEGAHY